MDYVSQLNSENFAKKYDVENIEPNKDPFMLFVTE